MLYQEVRLAWHESIDKNTDEKNDGYETCSATWMEAGHFFSVFDIQRKAFFVGINRFVLGAMVLENAMHAWSQTKQPNINDEKGSFQDAVDKIVIKIILIEGWNIFTQKIGYPERQKLKKEEAHAKSEDQ